MGTSFPIARRTFASLVERADDQIELDRAALVIAQEEYPSIDPRAYLHRLDDFARRARQRLGPVCSRREVVAAINLVLFETEGFRGNSEDYYDPRNSYLNDVLDRKLGIPISLSIVYLAVGRRLGVPAVGIGLPGHFIVGVDADERLLVDPFNRGALLTREDCAARVRQVYGDRLVFHPRMLRPLSNRQILTRVLNNLKAIYVQTDDNARLLATIDRLLLLNPDDSHELRDRGAVCQHLKFHGQALADFRRYLELAPQALDADKVRNALRSIERELAWRN